MAAPAENKNALRHGLLAANGAPFPGIKKHANKARRTFEAAALETHGSIDLYCAALISSATRWETHSMLCLRWLRSEHDKLTPGERLAFSREAARASSERDRCLKLLGLDKQHDSDPATAFYATSDNLEPQQ